MTISGGFSLFFIILNLAKHHIQFISFYYFAFFYAKINFHYDSTIEVNTFLLFLFISDFFTNNLLYLFPFLLNKKQHHHHLFFYHLFLNLTIFVFFYKIEKKVLTSFDKLKERNLYNASIVVPPSGSQPVSPRLHGSIEDLALF